MTNGTNAPVTNLTLLEAIKNQKARKGPSFAITKKGAFWLAAPELVVRACGGDGVNGTSIAYSVQARHYRDGKAAIYVHRESFSRDDGTFHHYIPTDASGIWSAEGLIQLLLGTHDDDRDSDSVYSNNARSEVVEWCAALGLPAQEPAPDEE